KHQAPSTKHQKPSTKNQAPKTRHPSPEVMADTVIWAALSQLLIATLHGFFGAWLAVRMVFRPRKAIIVWGIQLPFTPGMIPAERERFLTTFAQVIAERVLTVETIADELFRLGIRREMEVVSARQYAEQTGSDAFLHDIAERMVQVIEDTGNNRQVAERLDISVARGVIAAVDEKYGLLGQTVAKILVEAGLVRKVLAASLRDLAKEISQNPLSRAALLEAIAAAGHQIFPVRELKDELDGLPLVTPDLSAVDRFVISLSQRLDMERILKEQLMAFSDEMIEDLVYQAAGRELKMIIRFGAVVGFLIGLVQALLVVVSRWP
ncbi:MAG TPA: DUF445 family protein, partial [Acidobacteriota bacterium]|nr:DUF445 family protein [Acidobacteriota bacterium]